MEVNFSPNKESYLGIGLMSGTSLDGLDVALCRFYTNEIQTPELISYKTYSWPKDLEQIIRSVTSVKQADLYQLTYFNRKAAEFFSECIINLILESKYSPQDIDFIGSHGHTIYHIPSHKSEDKKAATLQLVDADHIAVSTGILTISDFRQKHIAFGGEGAPLVVYGDFAIYRSESENRFLVNIGGMANLTWLPAGESFERVRTTDTGPGNKLIDLAVQLFDYSKHFDEGGQFASMGEIDEIALENMLNDNFFKGIYPKSTGTEYFNAEWLLKYTSSLNAFDRIRTVTALTAKSIGKACLHYSDNKHFTVYISGGGIHNKVLIHDLQRELGLGNIKSIKDLGIYPDAKEAVLFAWLGFQTIQNRGVKSSEISGLKKNCLLGKISLPY